MRKIALNDIPSDQWHAVVVLGRLNDQGTHLIVPENVLTPSSIPFETFTLPAPVDLPMVEPVFDQPVNVISYPPSGVDVDSQGTVQQSTEWPWLVKLIAAHRQTGDKGIGDVLERLFKHVKADKLAKLYEKYTGKSCGCSSRRDYANARYPFRL